MIELESQGAEKFFGEPEFDVKDMLHVTSDGRGVVTCLELTDVQDKPALFSTFMMWMLAELYHNLPEAGDLPKPKLVFFFDEAHLLFDDAPKAFLDQIQQVVRLIRSKGVGVYMVTQTPKDVPTDVLAQLSNRIQHALRAHTPDDDAALKATIRTFPEDGVLRSRGDAHVTRHRRGGRDGARRSWLADACRRDPTHPAGLAHGTAHAGRAAGRHRQSDLLKEYGQAVDRDSAREKLAARMAPAAAGSAGRSGPPRPLRHEKAKPAPTRHADDRRRGTRRRSTSPVTLRAWPGESSGSSPASRFSARRGRDRARAGEH